MSEQIASFIWVLGIVAWTIIRIPHRRRAKRTGVAVDQRSVGERIALGFCIIGLVLIPAIHLFLWPISFSNFQFYGLAGWLGLTAMMAFLVMFYLSHKHLARNWSVSLEIREGHKLVDTGVYRIIRHPMYTSFWLWGLAQFLLIPNWIAGSVGLLSVAWLYFSRIDAEETMMRNVFGEDYDNYCSRTNRLLPKIL